MVVGYTYHVGLGLVIEDIGGQQRRHQGIREHLFNYTSINCFDNIIYSLQHTDQASDYADGFNLMRQWEEAEQEHGGRI